MTKNKRSLIIAHRGASSDAPENTHAAFDLAWKQGADGIEVDVRITKDREVVVIHDVTTKRTQRDKGESFNVEKSEYEKIKEMDVGNRKYPNQKIPLLKDVIQKLPKNKMILIEIKGKRWVIIDYLMKVIKQSGVQPSQVRLMCFSLHIVTKIKTKYPKYKVLWLCGMSKGDMIERCDMVKSKRSRFLLGPKQIVNFTRKAKLAGLSMHGGDSDSLSELNYRLIALAKQSGLEIHFWTIDDAKKAKALDFWEADSITTNNLKLLEKIIK